MSSNHSVASNSSSSHGGKNATAIAAAAAAAAAKKLQAQEMASMQAYNQKVPQYYAAAMISVIFLFTTFHWSRFLYSRYTSKGLRTSPLMRAQVAITRKFRHILTRGVPGFTSVGHALLVLAYLSINVCLTVTNVNWSSLSNIGKRLGWMAITNVAFITFLALKNTPLAFLTAYSYERLNPLHQIGGYVTIIYIFLHATMMCEFFTKIHDRALLIELPQIHAMTAASAAIVMLVTALLVRKLRYEVFYVTHIAMYSLLLINVAFHRPDFTLKAIIITLFAASMWSSDRILRGCRILWYTYDNRATITPLPHGGTRIVLRRSPSRAVPGTHCFLWIPKIRAIETHPFTIVSTTPYSLELVVAAYDGFTNDLHTYAQKHPGDSLRASIDGPYGAIPNFAKVADKVVLVAGGSGASFTFGVALDMIKKLGNSTKTSINFIWTVKEEEALSWFSKELIELQASPLVTCSLHTTRSPYPASLNNSPSPISPSSEKQPAPDISPVSSSSSPPFSTFTVDVEKQPSHFSHAANSWDSTTSLSVLPGRPDVEMLIKDVVAKADDNDRIAIAACGPEGLMSCVRRTAAECIRVKGPSVELHCEQFGW